MMRTASWIRLLAITAVLAAACGSVPATGNAPSASPSSLATTATPTATLPTSTLTPTATTRLALVTLRGSDKLVVRDITNINHPKTVGNLGTVTPYQAQFVSATEVSYATDAGLFRMPLTGSPKTLVVKDGGTGDWSPDGKGVVYTTFVSGNCAGTITVHQLRAGRDQVLGSVPAGGCGDCQTISNCGFSNYMDFRLLYSPDGSLISLVTTGFSGSSLRVWSSAGAVLQADNSRGGTMSAWSGPTLYFRDEKGVEVWRAGAISLFLPGVTWIKPRASSAGGQIVYTVRDSGGWGHVRVVDTTTRKVRELKSARTDAVFLSSRYVWYQGERACVASDVCGARPPFHPLNGKTYIYDLQTGTETESIITSVSDVWPHAA